MKVVFCWSGISGYMAACWRELVQREGIDVSLLCRASSMPWASSIKDGLPDLRVVTKDELSNYDFVHQLVVASQPDIVVLSGWTYQSFNRLPFSRDLAHCRFIMAMDNPWLGTWRQRLARIKIGFLLDRMDAVAVAGERCFQFARYLGVPEAKLMRGTYGIDYDGFAAIRARRMASPDRASRRFLFAGRYVRDKGVDILVEAYKSYRESVIDPWSLSCCGRGPLSALLNGIDGVTDHGFTQSDELLAMYGDAGVFLLASRFEPWGQVILEASAAGLPVICTEACGAGVEAVRPFYSGLVVPTGDAHALCEAMMWIHHHHDLIPQFGERAAQLAAPYSAQTWADRWMAKFNTMMSYGPMQQRRFCTK
jgi:glycosyltransferase involved in cell wall biosynthesis